MRSDADLGHTEALPPTFLYFFVLVDGKVMPGYLQIDHSLVLRENPNYGCYMQSLYGSCPWV